MKTRRCPWPLLFLLLLLGATAWTLPLPAHGSAWALPILAVFSWAATLFRSGLPARVWVAGAAMLGLIALYAWNPTHRWAEGIGLMPVAHVRGLPGSAIPTDTWTTLGLALAMFAAFALAFRLSEGQLRGLQMAAMLGAASMSLVVLFQRLGPDPTRIREYTGIFVNENHFAVFSNLLLPVVLAMASRARFTAVQVGRPSSPAGLYLLAAVLMGAAVVLCRSRAGAAVMALEIAAYVFLSTRALRQYPFSGIPFAGWMKILGALAIVAAVIFAFVAFAREWNHLGDIRSEWAFRSGILKDTLAAWRGAPIWGTGPGTFPTVFPYYQSAMFTGKTILHAHCEPVQFLSEFGVAGGLWMACAAWLGLSATRKNPLHSEALPPFADLERRAFALGLMACALHCLIDFPLRIPLIALIAATWAGVWAGSRSIPVELKD